MKKGIPEIREREGNEKKRSQNSGTGIRGYYSRNGREREREWTEKITMIRTDWKCSENKGRVPKKNEKLCPFDKKKKCLHIYS